MREKLFKSVVGFSIVVAAGAACFASVHLMVIQEVFVGTPQDQCAVGLTPDQRAQFIMLEMTSSGQVFTNGTRFRVEDADGNLLGYFGAFTANQVNGGSPCSYPNCPAIMMGTQAADDLFTFSFDKVVNGQAGRVALPAAAGRVCFTSGSGTTVYDCVAWGNFDCTKSGNCALPNGPRTGDLNGNTCDKNGDTPAAFSTGLIYGRSLTRTAFNCASTVNSTQFTIDIPTAWPNPINNANANNNGTDADSDGLISVLDCNDSNNAIQWPAIDSFVISVDAATVCLGTAQQYTAAVSGGVPSLNIAWDFSYDGVTFNAEGAGTPFTYTQLATGSYTVRARVIDSCGKAQTCFSNNLTVTVNAVPAANPANAAPNPVCLGSAVQFDANPTGGTGTYTYEWDYNEDFVVDSTTKNPLHTYPAEGSFNARVKVTDSNNCNTGWVAVPNNPVVVSTAEPPCGAVAPSEVSPAAVAANGTLSWADLTNEDNYEVFGADNGMLPNITSSGVGAGDCMARLGQNVTSFPTPAIPPGGTRFYLVRGVNAAGAGTLGTGGGGSARYPTATACP